MVLLPAFWAATGLSQPSPPSQSAESQVQAALGLEQQGRNAEAESAWRAFVKTHPSDADAYAHLGLLEARQEHYKEAVPLYRKAIALKSTLPGLHLNLGLALFKAGQLKDAIHEFEPLMNRQAAGSPEAQRLNILIGMAHYGLGEYGEAVPYLKQAAADDAQNLPLRLALAHSCLWSKQMQCVLDTFHEIITLNAESAEADMLAGEALDELKDSGGAIEQFRAAVKANPKEPNVHFGLGYLLWTKRQYPEAVSEFEAELANNPVHPQALTYLADAKIQMNQPDAAQPLLEKVVKAAPNLTLAHLDLGILYADAGRREDALREMKAAEKLAPNEVDIHWHLGKLYRSMGKKDEAKAEFDKASSITNAADTALINRMSGAGASGAAAGSTQGQGPDATPAKQ